MRRLVGMLFLLVAPGLLFAAPANFAQGKDFAVIAPSKLLPRQASKRVMVTEFFSFGCPWCFKLEPTIEQWQKQLPKNVTFERVPVVFEQGWQYYARAYYIADSLGLTHKFMPLLFSAVQKQGLNLKSNAAMIDFFVKNGVSKDIVSSAFESSPTIDAKMSLGAIKMQAYQIVAVPALVVDGKYRTDLRMAKGDSKRMLQIVNYLVKKTNNK